MGGYLNRLLSPSLSPCALSSAGVLCAPTESLPGRALYLTLLSRSSLLSVMRNAWHLHFQPFLFFFCPASNEGFPHDKEATSSEKLVSAATRNSHQRRTNNAQDGAYVPARRTRLTVRRTIDWIANRGPWLGGEKGRTWRRSACAASDARTHSSETYKN